MISGPLELSRAKGHKGQGSLKDHHLSAVNQSPVLKNKKKSHEQNISYLYDVPKHMPISGKRQMAQERQLLLPRLVQLKLIRVPHITVECSVTHCGKREETIVTHCGKKRCKKEKRWEETQWFFGPNEIMGPNGMKKVNVTQ